MNQKLRRVMVRETGEGSQELKSRGETPAEELRRELHAIARRLDAIEERLPAQRARGGRSGGARKRSG